jgi:protoporphyrinogen oxidase
LVEQENDTCYVTYVDAQGSEVTLESRSVIMACPKHYAPYIVKGLPEDQKRAFRKVRYDSYIVANVFTNDVIYDAAFATYFDDTIFTDMIIADWIVTSGNKKVGSGEPEVYTLYCPMGERGRYKVLTETAETWISQITNGINRYFPRAENKIVDIRLFRYGHHYVLGYPGFITGPRTIAKRPFGNIFFTKDDMQGVPCLESAVWSGLDAANGILQKMG